MLSTAQLKLLDELLSYQGASSSVTYSNDASGELDVERMLDRKKCWKSTSARKLKKTKKVIITDRSIQLTTRYYISDFWKLLYEEGKKRGVEFYAWTGQLIKITDQFDFQLQLKNIKPITPSDLKATLEQNHIAKDDALIIDYFKAQTISEDLGLIPPSVSYSKWSEFRLEQKEADIEFHEFDIVMSEQEFLTLLNSFEQDQGLNVYINDDRIQFFEHILNSDHTIKGLEFHGYGSLALPAYITKLQQYPHHHPNIKSLYLKTFIVTETQITTLVAMLPSIEMLTFKIEAISGNKLKVFNNASLPHLKKLDIYFDDKDELFILNELPNHIEALSLHNIDPKSLPENLTYPTIEKLKLTFELANNKHETLIDQNLVTFISKFPNLKCLELSRKISKHQLMQISYLCPKLEILKISVEEDEIKSKNYKEEDFKPAFSNLKEFELKTSNLTDTDLIQLTAYMPKLNRATFECAKSKGTFLNEFRLQTLEQLDLSAMNLSELNLETFLQNNKKLSTLSLMKCTNIPEFRSVASQIKTLYFDNLHTDDKQALSAEQLRNCFAHLKNLENLTFLSEPSSYAAGFQGLDLKSLKNIDIPIKRTDYNVTKALIMAAPNLSQINLQTEILKVCINKKLDFKQTSICLFNGHCNLTNAELEVILPNIKSTHAKFWTIALPQAVDGNFKYSKPIPFHDYAICGAAASEQEMESLIKIINASPNLNRITIDFDFWKSTALLDSFLKKVGVLPNIRHFDYNRHHNRIEYAQIELLLQKFPNLEEFICNKDLLTEEQIDHLVDQYPQQLRNGSFSRYVQAKLQTTQNKNRKETQNKIFPEQERNNKSGLKMEPFAHMEELLQKDTTMPSEFDARTKFKNSSVFSRVIFKKNNTGYPQPGIYRLKVENKMKIGRFIEFGSAPEFIEQITLSTQSYYPNDPNVFNGNFNLNMRKNSWYPLPSLTTQDELLSLKSNFTLQIGYNAHEQLYYVRTKETTDEKVSISFNIRIKPSVYSALTIPDRSLNTDQYFKDVYWDHHGQFVSSKPFDELLKLPEQMRIKYLCAYCYFTNKHAVDLMDDNNIDGLNMILKEKTGSCRHRTWLFKALADQLGIQCRIVTNDVHVFVEILHHDKWLAMDLGGYASKEELIQPSKMNLNEMQEMAAPLATPVLESKDISTKQTPTILTQQPATPSAAINIKSKTKIEERKKIAINPFVTWEKTKSAHTTFNKYIEDLLQQAQNLPANKRNLLIVVPTNELESFHQYLIEYFKQGERISFSLPSFDDVSEKTVQVFADGSYQKVDSPVVSFVKTAKANDAFIVDWSHYSASDVGYNTILDEKRKLKSIPIKDGVFVINVLDRAKANNLGEDFYSRIGLTSQCPTFARKNYTDQIKRLLANDFDTDTKIKYEQEGYLVIDFYDADWKKQLLGFISVHGKALKVEQANLIDAIKKGLPGIVLVNPPENLADFRFFIAELLARREFSIYGETFKVPQDFTITMVDKAYSLDRELLDITITEYPSIDDHIINKSTFNYLFSTKSCENLLLFQTDGWLAAHKNKSIAIYVTEELSAAEWHKIITEAQSNHCKLEIKVAPNVNIPTIDMNSVNLDRKHPRKELTEQIIISNDLDYEEEELIQQYPNALIVSVDKQTLFQDIIEGIQLVGEHEDFKFNSELSDIAKRLIAGDTVILKGNISAELADKLTSLFLTPPYTYINGVKTVLEGRLLLITEEEPLPFLPNKKYFRDNPSCWALLEKLYVTDATQKAYLDQLQLNCKLIEDNLQIKFSYCQLRSMFLKIKAGNFSNPFKPYFRLFQNKKAVEHAKRIWLKPEKSKDYIGDMQKRYQKISRELSTSNYVFIAGPSGVGKSTYIIDKLAEKHKVHVGIDYLSEWLKEGGILFIDEANIEEDGRWDLLEGAFNKTPGILLDKKFHKLTDNHKIIFAGNYGTFAGRHKHRFMERHGQVFNFKELSSEYISENILNPAIRANLSTLDKRDQETISRNLLDFYNKVNRLDETHPLTPRNLRMMIARLGLLNLSHRDICKDWDMISQFVALDELKGASLKTFRDYPDKEALHVYQLFDGLLNSQLKHHYHQFVNTNSRQSAMRSINQQIDLRELRIDNTLPGDNLPGIMLEGVAGIGKSMMVIESLKERGYREVTDSEKTMNGKKLYYHLTPTDPAKMEKILLKAFNEGAIVVIDELNSLPLERLINQLMMGKDMKGKSPAQKGFMIFATQNPITYVGRQALSSALENRFNKINLDDYPIEELRQICREICHDHSLVNETIDQYVEAKQYAHANRLFPEPTPRHLFSHMAKLAHMQTQILAPRM